MKYLTLKSIYHIYCYTSDPSDSELHVIRIILIRYSKNHACKVDNYVVLRLLCSHVLTILLLTNISPIANCHWYDAMVETLRVFEQLRNYKYVSKIRNEIFSTHPNRIRNHDIQTMRVTIC